MPHSTSNYGSASQMTLHYVYILESLSVPHTYYTGLTDNLDKRLGKHNRGEVAHTAKAVPWRIKNIFGFDSREKASAFERYLKSGSGRAFAKKHL